MIYAAALPPRKRLIPRGLSHDETQPQESANSCLGSCSPKLKQALADTLIPLNPPFLGEGSGTEPQHLVWRRRRAEYQQEYSCAPGECAGALGCSAHTKELGEGWGVPFSSVSSGHIPSGIPSKSPTCSSPTPCEHCTHTLQTSCPPKSSRQAVRYVSSWLTPNQLPLKKQNQTKKSQPNFLQTSEEYRDPEPRCSSLLPSYVKPLQGSAALVQTERCILWSIW